MSARYVGRSYGVVIRCNADGCEAKFQTSNTRIAVNRVTAKTAGWIRGGRSGTKTLAPTKRHDYCPEHAPAELAAIAELNKRRAERAQKRADKAKQRMAVQLEHERQAAAQEVGASP